MKRMVPSFFVVITCLSLVQVSPAEGPTHRKLSAVPFTEVKIQDNFWSQRQKTNREASVPHNFQWCEKTGRFSNFEKAGKKEGQWKEVPDVSAYGTEIDKYNRVTFGPVETTALRIEVRSKPKKWSGILEWTVEPADK